MNMLQDRKRGAAVNRLFDDVDEMMKLREQGPQAQLLYGIKNIEEPDHYVKVLQKNKVNVKNIYSQLNIPSVKTFERNNFSRKKVSQVVPGNKNGPVGEAKAAPDLNTLS